MVSTTAFSRLRRRNLAVQARSSTDACCKIWVKKGELPPNIAVAVSHLRDIGKYGAHDEEIEVARGDVPLIENLADAVLEFVYRSPAAIAALEKSIVDRGGQLSSSG